MTDIVERVARASCEADGFDPDDPLCTGSEDLLWTSWKAGARAAIAAMREPSEAMEQAYYAACDVNGMCLWKHGYRVMIDAALAAPPEVQS
jgi:hypothetical protein